MLNRFVPNHAQAIATVGEEMSIFAEDFERDRVVVIGAFEGADHFGPNDVAGADGKMQVAGAAFVVVRMDVRESFAINGAKVGRGIAFDH